MKALILPLAACAALGGCAYYGDPYYGGGYGYGYPSTSIGVYQSYPGYYHDDGHHRHRGPYSGGDNWRRPRDSDRDGIPNRFDRDRDNDGVPNARDPRPNNPRRR